MQELLNLNIEWQILIGINFFLILVLFLMNLSSKSKIKKLKTKYNRLMNGIGEGNLESVVEDCLDKVNMTIQKNKEIEYQINTIERNLYYCIQKVGIIRYNAFDNVGSDMSYSIALLDNNDDGVVFSSLYARDTSSTYAKPVSGGKSKYALSAEELKAIDMARKTQTAGKVNE